ncbi:DUF308 domain-containing protein [Candidatus Saccharibacteria bacterium]|nr:DUF308 domain-containing protein [Candidatus Saccharibacteria bacterium]
MSKVEIIKRPVDSIGTSLKQSAWTAILESLATVILGILLIIWPETIIKIIAYIVGVFFVVKGTYQVITYFLVKGQNDFFNNNLLIGIISALIGIAVLVMGEGIASVFRIAIGIWMVYEALIRMNTAIKLHAAGIITWKYVLILALLMLVIGVFITFFEGAVITLIGWMMILTGIIGIIGDGMFIQQVNTLAEKLTGVYNEKS